MNLMTSLMTLMKAQSTTMDSATNILTWLQLNRSSRSNKTTLLRKLSSRIYHRGVCNNTLNKHNMQDLKAELLNKVTHSTSDKRIHHRKSQLKQILIANILRQWRSAVFSQKVEHRNTKIYSMKLWKIKIQKNHWIE
jgi:hypothetical protein